MSELVMIYAPDGEPFEVHPHRVGDLVLNQGWSQTKPEDAPVEEAAPEPAPRARAKPTIYVEAQTADAG